ncbi:MAG: HD domain-containing phosphohydrolase [Candidatus Brocadiales bacterium]
MSRAINNYSADHKFVEPCAMHNEKDKKQLQEYVEYLEKEVELRTRKLDSTVKEFKVINEHLIKIATVVEQINKLSFVVNTTQNLDKIFNILTDYAKNLTAAEYCLIILDTAERKLSVGGSAGIPSQNRTVNILQGNNGFCRKVIEDGRPIRANNINCDGNTIGLRFEGLFVRDFMGVPFFCKGKTVGELVVLNKKETGGFTMEDHELLITLGNQAANAIESKKLQAAERETQLIVMLKMAQLAERRDPETGDHIDRIRFYSKVLAEGMRNFDDYKDIIDDNFVKAISEASPLHDIGKVGIPDGILLKPRGLTKEEFEVMKQHTTIGGNILEGPPFLRMGKEIALWHHEKHNGGGYPHKLSGSEIPLCAKIVALTDVYDAFTSKRVYKEEFSHEKAVEYIKGEAGKHFDPGVVKAFLDKTGEFLEIKEKTKIDSLFPKK